MPFLSIMIAVIFIIAKEANIRAGLLENKDAYITREYSTYEDALIFFLEKCNIVNAGEYFELEKLRLVLKGS